MSLEPYWYTVQARRRRTEAWTNWCTWVDEHTAVEERAYATSKGFEAQIVPAASSHVNLGEAYR